MHHAITVQGDADSLVHTLLAWGINIATVLAALGPQGYRVLELARLGGDFSKLFKTQMAMVTAIKADKMRFRSTVKSGR